MDNKTIDSLYEALKFSPDNVPLRLHLAETLVSVNRLDEAQKEFQQALEYGDNEIAKLGLARVFYKQDKYSQCNVILEELAEHDDAEFDVLLLHTRALVKEGEIGQAIEIYKRVLVINPNYYDEELDKELRSPVSKSGNDDDVDLDSKFIQKPTINFEDVGGMDDIKKQIDLKIIQPLKHPEMYKAYGKKLGGGILLYGPPGCGKTYLAKATAGQVNARFINVSLNDILDMWIGNSEKNLHEIFELARNNTPCVLFFDEIDALGASRTDMKQSSGRHLINQFLQELDGLESDNEGVLILGATNTPWHLDSAFRRPGRFDRIIFVPPPDADAREKILKLKVRDKPTEDIDFKSIAKKTDAYSGADIEAIIDISVEEILEQAIKEGSPKPISTKHLKRAIGRHKATTKEWFSTARNFALYANNSGLYDEILTYLKINK
jgi:SpoVK/Ycf46/Vps4 family AAA+-type ATPase